ncbi:MAG: adenine deaminase C-terminal domain-containing protein, partial [Prevotella sp.]|nr:adenine deaminase C-terminal domain-containing protein [Prevotella sp.]
LKECNVLATIERHGKNGNMAVCPLIGYGIKNGAVATSVAHDSHNVICAGDNGTDMAAACNRLREIGGGYVIASGGKVVDEFPLPCCGLMSEVASAEAIEGIARMERKAHELGVSNQIDPFITLSFLALPVIPDIRLLDTGLFDVLKSEFITSGINNR